MGEGCLFVCLSVRLLNLKTAWAMMLRGTLRGIYCLNYVIFDVIFDIFCSAMIPGYQHGPYIWPVYTGAFFAPVHMARIYG